MKMQLFGPTVALQAAFVLLAILCSFCFAQGPCPDGTPTAVTCTEGRTCPKDHVCLNGLCCPNCKRKSDDSNNLPSVLGAYVPQCDPSGTYTPEQCHGSTGICWCVTETGQEVPNTKVSPGGIRRESCANERQRFNGGGGGGGGGSPSSNTGINAGINAGGARTTNGSLGQCPTPVGFGVCVNNCNADTDCQNFGRKCCSNGCGKQCMVPVGGTTTSPDEKVGTCPRNIGQLGTISGDECFIDSQCFGGQKCCQTSIGKKCLSPDNAPPTDLNQGTETKSGFCPQVSSVGIITSNFRNDRCVQDRDCPNRFKCCDTINGKSCVDPLGQGETVIRPNQGQTATNDCTGLNEEYKSCGEACPKACDQLNQPSPSWCSGAGCASGCFCKSGYVRLDSRDPRSFCIPQTQCHTGNGPIGSLGPPVPGPFPGGKLGQCPTNQLHPAVAQTLTTGQSQLCNSDNDCQGDMKCCSTPAPVALNSLRCLCSDPNALWRECGTACPETCQQTPQICTSQCVPSCVCVDGYVKQSSSSNSPCVPKNECVLPIGAQSSGGSTFGGSNFGGSNFGGSTQNGGSTFGSNSGSVSRATAKLVSNLNVDGVLSFQQTGSVVRITGTVRGLQAGQHGIHIHTSGDLTNGCSSTGSHFDPERQEHGGPQSQTRHVGDLGNVSTDQSGTTSIDITDSRITLNSGSNSIIGRSIVIHENADDLGRGYTPGSKQNGNSGQPVACGVIGIVQ